MRRTILAISCALSTVTSVAQTDVSWQRYYPLAVGNVWEYGGRENVPDTRHEIIGERVVQGRRYFDRRIQTQQCAGCPVSTSQDVVWYDDGFVASAPSPDAGAPPFDPCGTDWFARPRSAAHGEVLACPTRADSVWVGYHDEPFTSQPWTQPAPADPVRFRSFFVSRVIWSYFERDIGPVQLGNLYGLSPQCARVGGVERGSPLFTAGDESPGARLALTVTLAPNPAPGALSFVVAGRRPGPVRYRAVDALGRTVASGTADALQPVGVALTPGAYSVEANDGASRAVVRATVVR